MGVCRVAFCLSLICLASSTVQSQTLDNPEVIETLPPPPGTVPVPLNDSRILGVIPNFQTVEDPSLKVAPLTAGQKFQLFYKESIDPYTIATSALGAAKSQIGNGFPKYGEGWGPYGQRFGAAMADETSQNFFSDFMLASLLHQDPRYFRKGPGSGFFVRVVYAVSRVAITRSDSGHERVNWSALIGTPMGIALSNAYYPRGSVDGSVMVSRLGTSFLGNALGNLLPEFWPDVRKRVFHRP